LILIAPDKFKGTYSAEEMCNFIATRLTKGGVSVPLILSPLSDGGEGIASALMPEASLLMEGLYLSEGKCLAVSSEIVGFGNFRDSGIPLMRRSSIRLGEAVRKAVNRHLKTYIAIGGTAISDGGAGFLQGLGAVFYDRSGNAIDSPLCPATIFGIASADLSPLQGLDLTGIVDVKASLVGDELSTLDFTRQKALPGEDLTRLEDSLRHLHDILGGSSEWDGAGGGLGYALASVIGAPCISGAQAAVSRLKIDWDKVRLIITGEGCVDEQTVRGGKLVDYLYREGVRREIPTVVLYGKKEGDIPYPHTAQIKSHWEDIVAGLIQSDNQTN